jgi:hypothetical protein
MKEIAKKSKETLLIRLCHTCAKVNESVIELERCSHCQKAFLPLQYFEKVHKNKSGPWINNFSRAEDLEEADLIKGLFVLW